MELKIEFISAERLAEKEGKAKIDFILGNVREDKILVLESPLSMQEEKSLITATMKKISPEFPGIEISTLGNGSNDLRSQLIKLLGGKTGGLTVVGPSKLVKQIKRDPTSISLLADAGSRRRK